MNCGVIDLGSNTIRLSIYQCKGREFSMLLNKKTMAGLASYVQEGSLSEEGISLAGAVVGGYVSLLENFGISDFYVFATASLRNISNTQEAVEAIFHQTGVQVDVISGELEATLAFQGAVGEQGVASGLLTDIGGGSTELVAYENRVITSECSLPMGSLSLYSKYVASLLPTKEERGDMKGVALRALEGVPMKGERFSHLYGVGGTVRAISKLGGSLLDKGEPLPSLSASEVKEVYSVLKSLDKPALARILHTCPDRVHTLMPGFALLNAIIKTFGIEQVTPSPTGVREGYLLHKVLSHHGESN